MSKQQKRKFDKIIANAEDAELVDKNATPEVQTPETTADSTTTNASATAENTTTETAPAPQPATSEPPAPSEEDMARKQRFDKEIHDCLNRHREKGGMAFDILKSIVGNKMDTVIQKKEFTELVTACFTLADVFKLEMDTRWTRDVAEISYNIYGKPATEPTEETKPAEAAVEPAKTEEAPTTTPEVTVSGTETIN